MGAPTTSAASRGRGLRRWPGRLGDHERDDVGLRAVLGSHRLGNDAQPIRDHLAERPAERIGERQAPYLSIIARKSRA